MHHPLLAIAIAVKTRSLALGDDSLRPTRDDRGEGVISTAIAILVMAFLGTMMWYGFKTTFSHAQTKTDDQVEMIGK